MRHLALIVIITLSACQTIHKPKPVPSVQPVLNALQAQKESLDSATGGNTQAIKQNQTALELAEQLYEVLNGTPAPSKKTSK